MLSPWYFTGRNVQTHQRRSASAHTTDEVYMIISGTGEFINEDTKSSFKPGDLLFVPAGVAHRFINFTNDFATWVLFYGPEEGEKK